MYEVNGDVKEKKQLLKLKKSKVIKDQTKYIWRES